MGYIWCSLRQRQAGSAFSTSACQSSAARRVATARRTRSFGTFRSAASSSPTLSTAMRMPRLRVTRMKTVARSRSHRTSVRQLELNNSRFALLNANSLSGKARQARAVHSLVYLNLNVMCACVRTSVCVRTFVDASNAMCGLSDRRW